MSEINFTGECFVPGQTNKMCEAEHYERYLFATNYIVGKEVIDIACGAGYGSHILKKAGAKSVIGLDISLENISHARHKYNEPDLGYRCHDAEQQLQETDIDVIISFETIEHVNRFELVLRNFYSALKSSGLLLISSPNRKLTDPYLGPNDKPSFQYHVREFTIDEFKDHLVKAGFFNILIFGQKQQFYFNMPFLEKHYKRLFKPWKKADPRVSELNASLQPEYFVMIAQKP